MKTFLLGCGAQKAGTTWLAKNLSSSPEYWNGGIKEWRFWKYYFDKDHRLRQLRKMKRHFREIARSSDQLRKRKLKWRISALQNPESFLKDIVNDFISNENLKVLGDMTPNNGILGINELAFIKEYFNGREIAVKPLFIMRDPFERVWSEVRMNIRNKHPERLQKNDRFMCKKLLEKYQKEAVQQKTRYERIVENLETVFGVQNICYEFSERLFSQEGLDRVTNHLSISDIEADMCLTNPSPKLTIVPTQTRYEIIRFYKDTYSSFAPNKSAINIF